MSHHVTWPLQLIPLMAKISNGFSRANLNFKETPVREIDLDPSHVMNYLCCIENIAFLWKFIDYFEKTLDAEIEAHNEYFPVSPMTTRDAYSKCPNFAAWLRLNVEFISNRILASISQTEKFQKKLTNYKFKKPVIAIIKRGKTEISRKGISETEFENMADALKAVVELRHSLQHGGLPHVLLGPTFEDLDPKKVALMIAPQNYRKTRKMFQNANRLLELMPKGKITFHPNATITLKKPGWK